jgi:hypothetical protein
MMANEAQGNGKDSGGKVVEIRVPILQIVFDPRTYAVTVTGNSPTFEFSKAMLQMALDEVERQILAARNQKLVELVSADALPMRG